MYFLFLAYFLLYSVSLSAFSIGEFELFVQKNASRYREMAIVVVSNDAIIFEKSYGKEFLTRLPIDLGSLENLITALAMAKLVDEGKLSWDHSIHSLYPGFFVIDPYITKHTTVRDLLLMRVGVEGSSLKTLKQVHPWRMTSRKEGVFKHVLEKIIGFKSGKTLKDFIQKNLFFPIGINEMTPYNLAKLLDKREELISRNILDEMENAQVPLHGALKNGSLFPEKGDFHAAGLGWHLILFKGKKILGLRDAETVVMVADKITVVIVCHGDSSNFIAEVGEKIL